MTNAKAAVSIKMDLVKRLPFAVQRGSNWHHDENYFDKVSVNERCLNVDRCKYCIWRKCELHALELEIVMKNKQSKENSNGGFRQ